MLRTTSRRPQAVPTRATHPEVLEPRLLLASDVRSYDGHGNNPLHDNWGVTGSSLLRLAKATYADGVADIDLARDGRAPDGLYSLDRLLEVFHRRQRVGRRVDLRGDVDRLVVVTSLEKPSRTDLASVGSIGNGIRGRQ